jgi:hypothetical protein
VNKLTENDDKTISEILCLLENPEELKKRLEAKLSKIDESDSILNSAIKILRLDCYLGTKEEIKKAKRTLKFIGSEAASPKEARTKGKRTRYPALEYFEADIETFFQLIESYKPLAKKALEQTKHLNKGWQASVRDERLANILQVPVGWLNQLDTYTPLTLAFVRIGYCFGIEFSSVKDLYYKPKPPKEMPVGYLTWVNNDGEPVQFTNKDNEPINFLTFGPAKNLGFTPELMETYWKIRK